MATSQFITRPNGTRIPIYYSSDAERIQSATKLLDSWDTYCNRNWMSENHEDAGSAERHIKAFLDGVAYLLMRGHSEDTMSSYKEMARGRSEIPLSSCPESVQAYLFGESLYDDAACAEQQIEQVPAYAEKVPDTKPARHSDNGRAGRIEMIRRMFPGCTFAFARVDTDNVFTHDGTSYQLSDEVAAYQPVETKEGMLFDMDTIVIVHHDGCRHFYTQDYRPIDCLHIHAV